MNIQLQTEPMTASNACFDLSPSGLLQCASLPSWDKSVGSRLGQPKAAPRGTARSARQQRARGQGGIVHEALRSPSQRHLLQAAVETELARLLTKGGLASLLTGGGALHRASANPIQLNSGTDPVDLGRQIAGSVYGGIGK